MARTPNRLAGLVGEAITRLLAEREDVTADQVVEIVLRDHPKDVATALADRQRKFVRSMARSTLRKRSDEPLQGELPLGVPSDWLLRCRSAEDGSVGYVLAAEANEDDLIDAERERTYAVTQAEARLESAKAGAERGLERRQQELGRFRELASRLNGHDR